MIEAVVTYKAPVTPDKSLLYKTSSDLSLTLGYLMPIAEHAMRVHDSAMFASKAAYSFDILMFESAKKIEGKLKVNKDNFVGSQLKGVFSQDFVFGKQHNYKEPFFKQYYDFAGHDTIYGVDYSDPVLGNKFSSNLQYNRANIWMKSNNLNNEVIAYVHYDYVNFFGGAGYNDSGLFTRRLDGSKGIIATDYTQSVGRHMDYSNILTIESARIGTQSKGMYDKDTSVLISRDMRYLNSYKTYMSIGVPSRFVYSKLTDATLKTMTSGITHTNMLFTDITTKTLDSNYSKVFISLPSKVITEHDNGVGISRSMKSLFDLEIMFVDRTSDKLYASEILFADISTKTVRDAESALHIDKTNNSLFSTTSLYVHKQNNGLFSNEEDAFVHKISDGIFSNLNDIFMSGEYVPVRYSSEYINVFKSNQGIVFNEEPMAISRYYRDMHIEYSDLTFNKRALDTAVNDDVINMYKYDVGIVANKDIFIKRHYDNNHADYDRTPLLVYKSDTGIFDQEKVITIFKEDIRIGVVNTGLMVFRSFIKKTRILDSLFISETGRGISCDQEPVWYSKDHKPLYHVNTDVYLNKHNKPVTYDDSLLIERINLFPVFEKDTTTHLGKWYSSIGYEDDTLTLYGMPLPLFSYVSDANASKTPVSTGAMTDSVLFGKYGKPIFSIDTTVNAGKWYEDVDIAYTDVYGGKGNKHTNIEDHTMHLKDYVIKHLFINEEQESVDALLYEARIVDTHLIEQHYQAMEIQDVFGVKTPPKLPVNMNNQQEFLAIYDVRHINVQRECDGVHSNTPDKYVIENYQELSGIDELILGQSDFDYSVYEGGLMVNGDVNPSYIKRIEDDNLFIKYPIENPVKLMSDIATIYKDVPVNTVEYITKKAYSIWRQNIFTYSGMKPDDALRDLVKRVYENLELQFTNDKNLYQAYRVARLFRWYAEMSVLNNSEYMLKLNCSNVTPNYDNIDIVDIGKIISFTNLDISQDLLVESVDRGKECSMMIECEKYHVFYITAKMYMYDGSVTVTVNDKEYTYTEPYTELRIAVPVGQSSFSLVFTPKSQEAAVQFSQLTVEAYDILSYDIIYNGKIGESNKTIEYLMDTLIIAEDSIDYVQKNIAMATPVANALDAMRNYFEIHHKDKDKGKRLINKFS